MLAVASFFDAATCSVAHVAVDVRHKRCAVIDALLEWDADHGRTTGGLAERIVAFIESGPYGVDWILETHIHADHVSAAPLLRARLGAPVGIGAGVVDLRARMLGTFGVDTSGRGRFDRLLHDGDALRVGRHTVNVMATPGHTPACVAYVAPGVAFVGDTLFMPDYGTARADFPGGDARALYRSIRRLLSLPADTRLFSGHDYLPAQGRCRHMWMSSVRTQRGENVHVRDGVAEDTFAALREARDRTLSPPALMCVAVARNLNDVREWDAGERNDLQA